MQGKTLCVLTVILTNWKRKSREPKHRKKPKIKFFTTEKIRSMRKEVFSNISEENNYMVRE